MAPSDRGPERPPEDKPPARVVRSPRGTELRCKGWVQEAALRLLMNNLDPEVAERPGDLVVYGGTGKAARDWPSYDRIVASLEQLEDDETLLVQSGKPVAIFRSHPDAPRVLIANSNLVGKWATWEHFGELEKKGLIMYGQMTAGSWIYIGTQGILQGTYETFVSAARVHYGADDLAGRIVLTGGLGGMGGAQPLAATHGRRGVARRRGRSEARSQRRLETRYLDEIADDLDDAVARVERYRDQRVARSVGVVGNCADVLPELLRRGFKPDLVTDQTSAHDPLNGYIPDGLTLAQAADLREDGPGRVRQAARKRRCAATSRRWSGSSTPARTCSTTATTSAQAPRTQGTGVPTRIPGFVPAYIRPLFCEGKGPFRWVALSGDPNDILVTDQALIDAFPADTALIRWLRMAEERVAFQGLPARICWLGYGDRAKAGRIFNDLVRDGKVKAPIVIGRDHLDAGSVASPNRETEAMLDGSDAIADWPILNALINAVNGASWVSVHHGGGVGIGYSLHAGMVIVADGTEDAARRLERVLTSDPGMGVVRHADAGYPRAIEVARERGVRIPGINPPE